MQSVHERIDRLSVMIDSSFPEMAGFRQKKTCTCATREVACMLKVSRRTLGEYRSNGTLPYYGVLARQGLVQEERDRAGVEPGIQGCRQDAGKRMKITFPFLLRT